MLTPCIFQVIYLHRPLTEISTFSVCYTMSSISLGRKQWDSTWAGLPRKIRTLILQDLMQDGCTLARLAKVSREWQTELERYNFSRIKVTPSRLVDFSSMIHRNRALVDYIWSAWNLITVAAPGARPTVQCSQMWSMKRHFLSAMQIAVLSPRRSRTCSRFAAHGIFMAIWYLILVSTRLVTRNIGSNI